MLIEAVELTKEFKLSRQRSGMLGAMASLFDYHHTVMRAVDRVSFQVERGELVGFLGPNGAGKSTTIKMLTGILHPTSGQLVVGGINPFQNRRRHVRRLGVVFGQRSNLWWDLPVRDSYLLLKRIYKVEESRYKRNMALFTELLGLNGFIDKPVRSLSLGQRMRADLAASLLHDPEILFLDEPTIGLDVLAKERIRDFIRHINADKQTTVILTTHDLGDIEHLCKRVMLIDKGKLVFDGPIADLLKRFGGERQLVVELAQHYDELELPGARLVSYEGRRATFAFPTGDVGPLVAELSKRYAWVDLNLKEPDIATTLKRVYAG